MPALSSPTTWRTTPYRQKGYLFVLNPPVVFKARVNQTEFPYPLLLFSYDTVTYGAYTDVEAGMTLLLGTSEGADDLGRQRITDIDSSSIYIGWTSRGTNDGELWFANDAYITVLDDYRVWADIPRFRDDGTGYKRGSIRAGDYPQQQPPIANAGPGTMDFVNTGTNKYRVTLPPDGISAGVAVADGASIASYLWDIGDGTLVGGYALSDSQIEVDFPPGFRWVKLTVTDSNGQSSINRCPVMALETTGSNAPIVNAWVKRKRRYDGVTLEVNIKDELPLTDYPDGTLVMFMLKEKYGSSEGSLNGVDGREHMKFIGWHDITPHSMNARPTHIEKLQTFNCIDVAGRLRVLPGFPQTIRRKATASNWREMKGSDINKYIHYLLYWHSTALEVAPFTLATDGGSYPFSALESGGDSLYHQVDERGGAIAHLLTCDSTSQLKVLPDPMLQDSADRTETSIVTIEDSDYTGVKWTRRRHPRYHWQDGAAILTNTGDASSANIVPVFALAPGRSPGQGLQRSMRNYQLVTSQTELNARTGHQYARANAIFDLVKLTGFRGGDAGIEPANMEWVTLNMTEYSLGTTRFRNQRCLPVEVSETYLPATGQTKVDLTLEVETVGLPAITVLPDSLTWPDWDFGWDVFPTINWFDNPFLDQLAADLGLTLAEMNIALAGVNPAGYSDSFLSDFVEWDDVTGSMAGTVAGMTAKYVGGALIAYVVTYSGTTGYVYRNADVVANPSNWSQDHTWTISGSNFAGSIVIEQSKTTDLVVVAWHARDAVRYIRRWSAAWGSVTVVNSTFTDDEDNDGAALGLAIVGTRQVLCGMSAQGEYILFDADSNGAFAYVPNGPVDPSLRPIASIILDSNNTALCDYADTLKSGTTDYSQSDTWTTTSDVNLSVGTDDSDDPNHQVRVAPYTGGSGCDPGAVGTMKRTDLFVWDDGFVADGVTEFLFTQAVAFWGTGCGDPPDTTITYTVTITTRNQGTIVVNDSEDVTPTYSAPYWIWTIDLASDLGVTYPVVIDQIEIEWENSSLSLAYTGWTYWSTGLSFIFTTPDNYQGKVYHIDDVTDGAPTWTDVTPGSADQLPAHKNGLAFDALNSNNVLCATNDYEGYGVLYASSDQGSSWDSGEDRNFLWVKFADDLRIAGGVNFLYMSTNAGTTYESKYGDFGSEVGAGLIETAAVIFAV